MADCHPFHSSRNRVIIDHYLRFRSRIMKTEILFPRFFFFNPRPQVVFLNPPFSLSTRKGNNGCKRIPSLIGACAHTGIQHRDVIVRQFNSILKAAFSSIHTSTALNRPFQKSPLWRALLKWRIFAILVSVFTGYVWTVVQFLRFQTKTGTCGPGHGLFEWRHWTHKSDSLFQAFRVTHGVQMVGNR